MKRRLTFFLGLLVAVTLCPSLVFSEEVDTDGDGLSDILEKVYGTNALNSDTDGDGFFDGTEVGEGFSPNHGANVLLSTVDSDGDGLFDAQEVQFGTNMHGKDSDNDGHTDYVELMEGYSPNDGSPQARISRELLVNRSTQMMQYVAGGQALYEFPVSTGNPNTPTPDGVFSIGKKIPSKRYVGVGYDLKNVKWNMEFKTGGYYIHAAYWHNDFGLKTHSHGCINMREPDAKILFTYLDEGVPVRVTGTTPKKRTVGT